jgi:bifunctional DNA-binding transcriptional regulator/antitoxin component of YhaV-PrlF toxin-antitoxin module
MGITQMFADTRKVQHGDHCMQITIPKDVADELGIGPDDEVLWTAEEGDDTASIHSPESTGVSRPPAES